MENTSSPAAEDTPLTTPAKALALNLDPATYGGFAEIGGGQEVARWFFSVGSAVTGVAKAISAYDMAVSDALYGPTRISLNEARFSAWQVLMRLLEHHEQRPVSPYARQVSAPEESLKQDSGNEPDDEVDNF